MKHLNLTVTGRVQGVSFRNFTQVKAASLGLKGFVMNQADGTVYIEAEGKAEALKDLITWLKQETPLARVEMVAIKTGKIQGFATFEIRS
ncbi:hypothetical protein A2W24_02985 [Microgenomates group bacterium RBG_16_45_19]|nr:MAG: hypothetical protein A2W24_02985 [Microgenomates group bacterium RBG_16_45_19]